MTLSPPDTADELRGPRTLLRGADLVSSIRLLGGRFGRTNTYHLVLDAEVAQSGNAFVAGIYVVGDATP